MAPARGLSGLLLIGALACSSPRDDEASSETSTSDGSSSETTITGETATETSATETSATETSATETGEPPGFCGDGLLDPGEACDDANSDEADGCLMSCEIGPCGFEWSTRELVLTGSEFAVHAPLVIDGDDLLVAHQLGEGGLQTNLLRASKADGQAFASDELVFAEGLPEVHSLIAGPGGDLFLARVGATDTVEIHRLDGSGNIMWSVVRPSVALVPDMQLSPSDELVLVNSIDNGPMDDQVELAALDPADGSELWSHAFGGPIAPNGFSTDRGAALVLADDGRAFVAYDQYDDWDTINPVVIAFGPDGDPTALWTTEVLDDPSRQYDIRDIALGANGKLAVSFQRRSASQIFWIAQLDAETGALDWAVQRDDFGLPNTLSVIRGLAVTEDRVVATGTWRTKVDDVDVVQAYVLGLDFDGALVCVGTLDDYNPQTVRANGSYLPMDMHVGADGGLYISGYVYGQNTGNVDLLLARAR